MGAHFLRCGWDMSENLPLKDIGDYNSPFQCKINTFLRLCAQRNSVTCFYCFYWDCLWRRSVIRCNSKSRSQTVLTGIATFKICQCVAQINRIHMDNPSFLDVCKIGHPTCLLHIISHFSSTRECGKRKSGPLARSESTTRRICFIQWLDLNVQAQ